MRKEKMTYHRGIAPMVAELGCKTFTMINCKCCLAR